ncbi:MAG: hypothetical protein GX139_07115 [Armatimonadetes bacterium]|nr:hypothetical protein [Armatimonadota bacterium]
MKAIRLILLICLLGAFAVPAFCAEEAAPAEEVTIPIADRPSLAIVALDDGSIKRETWWGTNWDVGSGLSDILTTTQLEKNRFRLMERSLLDKAIAEQDLSASSRVDSQTAVKIGKIISADYLVMGKVTQFAWETRDKGGVGGLIGGAIGVKSSNTKANVALDIRIVDAETAEILGSYQGKGDDSKGKVKVGVGNRHFLAGIEFGSSDFMNTILGVATQKAIDDWVQNFCAAIDSKKLTLTPKNRVPVRPDGVILDVEGLVVVANTGTSKGYRLGDKVELHKKGKVLKDPDTGEVLKVMTELIAVGTITDIDEKTAEIKFDSVEGGSAPQEGDIIKHPSAG